MITAKAMSCLLLLTLAFPLFGEEVFAPSDPLLGRLRVSVVSSEGEPVPGAEVYLYPLTSPAGEKLSAMVSFQGRTKPDPVSEGLFVSEVNPGSYRVRVQAEDWQAKSIEGVAVRAGAAGELEVALEPGYFIAGRVIDEEGNHLDGVRVRSWSSEFPATWTDSAEGGHFRLSRLARGVHNVTASPPGYARASADNVPTGTENLELVLKKEFVIRGELRGDTEGLREPVRVEVVRRKTRPGGSGVTHRRRIPVRPDADNIFQVAGLEEGSYDLRVQSGDYYSDWIRNVVALPPEEAEPVAITVRKSAVISGRVFDARTGRPMAGVVVSLRPAASAWRPAVTDSEGQYRLSLIPPGEYTLRGRLDADPRARSRFEKDLVLSAGQEISGLDFRIAAGREVGFSGRVVSETNEPVAGARLKLFFRAPPREHFERISTEIANSDAVGDFAFSCYFEGSAEFQLVAEKRGRAPGVSETVFLSEEGNELSGLTVRLSAGSDLKVEVVDGSGQPLPDAMVVLSGASGRGRESALSRQSSVRWRLTDSSGICVFEDLAPRYYLVRAEKKGYAAAEETAEMGRGDLAGSVRVVLAPGRDLRVTVRDDAGAPVAAAEISARWGNGSRSRSYSRGRNITDPAGFCLVEDLPGQPVTLTVSAEGYASVRDVPVSDDRDEAEVVLKRAGRITGRLLGPDGSGVNDDISVRIIPRDHIYDFDPLTDDYRSIRRARLRAISFRRPVNHGDGRFTLPDLAPGDYDLRITIPGFAIKRIEGAEVVAGRKTDIGERRLDREGIISGRVIDAEDGSPLTAALVRLYFPGYYRVDFDGTFEITGIPAGVYTLSVKARGWEAKEIPGIRIVPGERKELAAVELMPLVLLE